MSFSETIFLFFLALIIFGPKKLPEIARQAGKLLAELRRASNEFKSQIETEISHLEVEKKQTVLPPAGPPPGAIASLSLSPATAEAPQHEARGTLVAPSDPSHATLAAESAAVSPLADNSSPSQVDAAAPVPSSVTGPESSPAPQDSHV
jgi:sec-independent protein translocase protein TatB